LANNLYEEFVKKAKDKGVTVGTGQFAAHMMVELTNDGPVTILLDSSKSF
ncbi:D-Tyr-tRNA(Tyr) deacylase family protein, partial [Clostridioides difficile CD175]